RSGQGGRRETTRRADSATRGTRASARTPSAGPAPRPPRNTAIPAPGRRWWRPGYRSPPSGCRCPGLRARSGSRRESNRSRTRPRWRGSRGPGCSPRTGPSLVAPDSMFPGFRVPEECRPARLEDLVGQLIIVVPADVQPVTILAVAMDVMAPATHRLQEFGHRQGTARRQEVPRDRVEDVDPHADLEGILRLLLIPCQDMGVIAEEQDAEVDLHFARVRGDGRRRTP